MTIEDVVQTIKKEIERRMSMKEKNVTIETMQGLVSEMVKKYQKRFNEKGSIGSEKIEIDK